MSRARPSVQLFRDPPENRMGRALAVISFVTLALTACEAGGGGGPRHAGGSGASAGLGGGSSAGFPGGGAAGSPGGATSAGGAVSDGIPLLPARIRRLTNAEFDASAKALLGVESTFGQAFTPDTRQDGFTRNDAQRVDPVFITQLADAAQQLAAAVHDKIAQLAPCSVPAGTEACARTFLTSFAEKAYRRPVTASEVDALVTVYRAGADGATYTDGVQTAIQAVLQSPGFIYVTEIGETSLAPKVTLTQYEIASNLAYLVTGDPPDAQLLAAAKAGELTNADKRQAHLERLLAAQPAQPQVVQFVEEWLGIDRIAQTAKDSNAYPTFAALRDAMKKEAYDFASEVMWKSGGSASDLFSADWTIADDPLARMYLKLQPNDPIPRNGNHVSLASVRRRGILDQGSFLSVYSHAIETGPVLRGVAVLRRVACNDVPPPESKNVNVVPPLPDPSKTTRERFEVHATDGFCASCHERIDAVGFTFEGLDAMGRERQKDNDKDIKTATTLLAGLSFDGNYADSAELALAIAGSPDLRACFAKRLFRFAVTRSDAGSEPAEDAFMTIAGALPANAQGKVRDILTALVKNDAFVTRKASE
jgi:hypothetical protein